MGLIIRVKGFEFTNWVDETGGDDEVSRFINAAGLDSSYKARLDVLVNSLKDAGIWSKITALYPFLGNSFESMSCNLKDVQVAKLSLVNNPTIQIIKDIGWKRTAGGYISTNYGFPSSQLNNYHMFACTDVDYNSASLCVPIGTGANHNGSCIILIDSKVIQFRNSINNGLRTSAATLPSTGGLIMASTKGISLNGAIKTTTNLSNGNINNTLNGIPICLGGYNAADAWTPETATLLTCQYKVAGFGTELTTAEMQEYSRILNDFKAIY